MEYPEEIYATRDGGLLTSKQRKNAGSGWGRRLAFDVGYDVGYVAGRNEQSDYIESMSSLESVLTDVEQLEGEDLPFVKRLIERTVRAVRAEQTDPLAGYSNLTAAISAGEPIYWEELHGRNVKCVNPELRGEVHGTLKRDAEVNAKLSGAWRNRGMDEVYTTALWAGWRGKRGWSLWVEGEVPLRRKTADQLDEGRCFLGKQGADFDPELMIVVGFTEDPKLNKIKPLGEHPGYLDPWQVEVLEEYGIGTFQKPEGK